MFKASLQAIPKFSSFNHSGVDVIEEGHWAGHAPLENPTILPGRAIPGAPKIFYYPF